MSQWQPQQYDPAQHRQRIAAPSHPAQAQPPQQPHAPGYGQPVQQSRNGRVIFMWAFLAVQAMFLAWMIHALIATHDAAANCQGQSLIQSVCADVTNAAGGIAISLIAKFWAGADIIMGITYAVVRSSWRA